jgi:hypothetical protein
MIHLRFKELKIVSPVFFGMVHRRVGALYQGFGILSIPRVDAHADAAIDMQIRSSNGMRAKEGFPGQTRR